MHIPRKENQEVDDIAKRASKRQAQLPGVSEESLVKASIKQPPEAMPASTDEALPPPPTDGAPDCGPPTGERLSLIAAHQEARWIDEIKDYLDKGIHPRKMLKRSESLAKQNLTKSSREISNASAQTALHSNAFLLKKGKC